jgi:hypothetical protein
VACPFLSIVPTALVLHMASVHIPARNYNNLNLGIAAQFACSETISFQAGTYFNSVERQTFYAGATYEPKWFPIFLSLSAATGYQPYPILLPIIGARIGKNLRIGVVPYAGKYNDSSVVHFMWDIDL